MKKHNSPVKFLLALILCLGLVFACACSGFEIPLPGPDDTNGETGDGTNDDTNNGTNDGTNNGTNDGTNNGTNDGTNDDTNNGTNNGTNDGTGDGTNDGTNDDTNNENEGTNGDTNEDVGTEEKYPLITIEDALNIIEDQDGYESQERYYLKGVIVEILDENYGKLTLRDATGDILVYGTYSADGSVNFPNLSRKPLVGDEIIVHCILKNYKGQKEVYKANLVEIVEKEAPDVELPDYGTPIVISTAEELRKLADDINQGTISGRCEVNLGDNIDMQGVSFSPIVNFRGLFDGKGYKISNLTLPKTGADISLTDGNWVGYHVEAIGLFGSAYDAIVINLTLENVNATYDTEDEIFVGALVGYAEGITVKNCTVSSSFDIQVSHTNVTVKNISGISGLIGYSLEAYIEDVTVDSKIDYEANSYEAFTGAVLGVGNVVIEACDITLAISFVGTTYGHTGSLIGMERTPDGVAVTTIHNSKIRGTLYIDNPMGYSWGEVGQGYFYHQDLTILNVRQYNDVLVEVTYPE